MSSSLAYCKHSILTRSVCSIGSQFPLTQKEVEDGAMEGKRRQEKRLERAAVRPDPLGETRSEAGQIELESLYINTVNVGKERRRAKRERLRVAVEITHPALHLPVYCTWTGTRHVTNKIIDRFKSEAEPLFKNLERLKLIPCIRSVC